MFRTGYEIFVHDIDELPEGQELLRYVMDMERYEPRYVKAFFSPSAEKLPDGEQLWVRAITGILLDEKPWRIKITGRV